MAQCRVAQAEVRQLSSGVAELAFGHIFLCVVPAEACYDENSRGGADRAGASTVEGPSPQIARQSQITGSSGPAQWKRTGTTKACRNTTGASLSSGTELQEQQRRSISARTRRKRISRCWPQSPI